MARIVGIVLVIVVVVVIAAFVRGADPDRQRACELLGGELSMWGNCSYGS